MIPGGHVQQQGVETVADACLLLDELIPRVHQQFEVGVEVRRVHDRQVDRIEGSQRRLDGKAGRSKIHTDSERTNTSSASLTLSWLLYDSGARSANLENARQLLSAAASTLDATVQNVFFSALQAYYNTQAARAAYDRALALGMPKTRVVPYLAEAAYDLNDYTRVRALMQELGNWQSLPRLRPVITYWNRT